MTLRILVRVVLVCLWFSTADGAVVVDGHGIFPVVVQIRDDRGEPLQGASIRLVESGRLDPASIDDPVFRRAMSQLEKPVQSDAVGSALVYYYGRWSAASSIGWVGIYRQELHGRIIVEAPGFFPGEVNVAKGEAIHIDRDKAPIVTVTLQRVKPVRD
jgi:hypothetical protein